MKRESLHEEQPEENLSMGSCLGQEGHESETDTKQDSEASYTYKDYQEDLIYVAKHEFVAFREQIEKAQKFFEKHIVVPAEPLSSFWAHERAGDLVDGWQILEHSCPRAQRIEALVLMFKHERIADKPNWEEGLDGTRFMPFPDPYSYGAEQAKKFVSSGLAKDF